MSGASKPRALRPLAAIGAAILARGLITLPTVAGATTPSVKAATADAANMRSVG